VIAAAVVAAMASPVVTGRDSFPLSTYPMFSSDRSSSEPIDTVVGVDADGTLQRLTPHIISGGPEIVTAAVRVSAEIRAGRAAELCAEVAERHGHRWPAYEVLTERYDAVAWYGDGDRTPIEITVHATCA
jgi:hypothetical protein